MRARHFAAAVLLAGALASTGCDALKQAVKSAAGGEAVALFEGNNIVDAVARLKSAAGGGGIQCLELNVYSERAELQYQDSKKPENADAYVWDRGQLKGPLPVKLMGGGSLADNVFPLDDLKADVLPALFKQALERTKLEGGKISRLTVRRYFSDMSPRMRQMLADAARRSGRKPPTPEPFADGAIALKLDVVGTRHNATVRADRNGNIVEVKVY